MNDSQAKFSNGGGNRPNNDPLGWQETRPPVTGRFMAAYTFATFASYTAILTPVIVTIALKVSRLADAAEKASYLASVLAIGAFCALLAGPIWGVISDRTTFRGGRRKLWMVMGCLFLLAGLTTMALSTTLLGLGLGWLICQIGANANHSALNALLPDLVPPQQQGWMSALIGVAPNLAYLSAAFITQFTRENDLAMFLVPWVLLPIALAFLLSSFEDKPASIQAPFSWQDLLRTYWVSPTKHPDFAWAFVSRFLVFLSASFFMSFQLYYLTDHLGVGDAEVVGLLFYSTLITTGLAVVFTPLSGWLSDRAGRRKPFVIGAGAFVGAGLIMVSMATNFTEFLIAAVIYGVGLASYLSVDIALCTAVLPDPDGAAKDMALIHVANSLPQSLAPTIAPVFLAIGTAASPNYTALFSAAAVFAFIGASAILPIRGTR